MLQRSAGGRFLEIVLFTIFSLVLYHVGNQVGIGIIVFLIPLQVLASRRGEASLLAACGLFLLAFLALRTVPILSGQPGPDILTIVEMILVAFLLASLLLVNFPPLARVRALYRLLGVSAVAALAAVPMTIWLSGNAQFQKALSALFADASRMITSMFTGGLDTADSALLSLLSPEGIRRMSEAFLSRSALALFFGLLSFSWWAGQASASRSVWPPRARFHFSAFRLESFWLWVLIGALALILADLFFGSRLSGTGVYAQYAAWNIGLVVVFLYGLQGLAIGRFLFEKNGLPRFLWLMLLVVLAVLGASPRVGFFVILALAAFGVSENWIRLRVDPDRKPNEVD
jgi:hypothetical protein